MSFVDALHYTVVTLTSSSLIASLTADYIIRLEVIYRLKMTTLPVDYSHRIWCSSGGCIASTLQSVAAVNI